MLEVSNAGSVTNWFDLIRAGDQEAVARLWERYFEPLVAIAHRKLGHIPQSTFDAEDVALSAFHTFYQAVCGDRFQDLASRDDLWRSLLVIAMGKVIDARRRATCQKRGGGHSGRPLSALDSMSVMVESSLCVNDDPEVAAILAEEFDALLERLDDFELKQIAVLKLEGHTNAEIADRLACSERTVKRRLTLIRRLWNED